MIGKSPGLVVCAHCGRQSADADCQGCKRMVCAGCRADWGGCPITHAWATNLGDHELVGFDGSGSYGLVRKKLSFVQRVLGVPPAIGIQRLSDCTWTLAPRSDWSEPGALSSVSREGTAVLGKRIGDSLTQRLVRVGPASGSGAEREPREPGGQSGADRWSVPWDARVTRDDRAVWFIRDNLLQRLDLASGGLDRIAGLPQRLAIQAVDYDPEVRRLVIGTWAKLYVFSVTDKIEPQARLDLGMVDVERLFFRGRHALVRCVDGAQQRELRLYAIGDEQIESRRFAQPPVPLSSSPLCDISDDGRWLALPGRMGRVLLYDLEAGTPEILDQHEVQLTALRFTDNDALLASADSSGRVVLRPRDGKHFSEHVVEH